MASSAIKGEYMEACSCDFLCPCISGAPERTNGHFAPFDWHGQVA